jgi:RNA polymerase sigma-70 factor, ECF subfamily
VSTSATEEVTRLLRRWGGGDPAALDQLTPVLYRELRRVAAGHLRRERPGHTLQPTALVHETYLRLIGSDQPEWSDRAHFFAIAARHMRQILVDHARRRNARKRGGGQAVTLDEGLPATARPLDVIALDDALEALARLDQRKARILELHYFGGLGQEEIAAVLEVHVNTVARDLRLARAWLRLQLEGPA